MAASSAFQSVKLYAVYVCLQLLLAQSRYGVSHTIVTNLPGLDGPLPFELETGYVSVDEQNDVQLFYYFVKSERNPIEDPLLVWISGGPGCSALTAFAFEFGPVFFKIEEYNGGLPRLVLNPHSWTKAANIIFLDAPVGTGYSYSGSIQGSYTSVTKSAKQAYTFIRKWLIDHPQYLSNPLYFGGDSASGIIVPIIVQDVSDGIEAGDNPPINLKGYILGNPSTDSYIDYNSQVPFAHGMGLISDELYESTKRTCRGNYVNVDPQNALCTNNLNAISEVGINTVIWISIHRSHLATYIVCEGNCFPHQCTSQINSAHILEPKCLLVSPKPPNKRIRDRSSLEEYSSSVIYSPPPYPGIECRSYGYMLSYYWANNYRVRRALNIRKGTVDEWERCKFGLDGHFSYDVTSSVPYHSNLSRRQYRSLIYSGDHDMLVPLWGTQSWIKSLNYSIIDQWRPWFVDGQVAGYTKAYTNNMTYATVKGGGHTAPEYKPKECFAMFKRWCSEEPL